MYSIAYKQPPLATMCSYSAILTMSSIRHFDSERRLPEVARASACNTATGDLIIVQVNPMARALGARPPGS